jgi:hypothetical protein
LKYTLKWEHKAGKPNVFMASSEIDKALMQMIKTYSGKAIALLILFSSFMAIQLPEALAQQKPQVACYSAQLQSASFGLLQRYPFPKELNPIARRDSIIEVARRHLGLEKATNLHYVVERLSLGKDQPWCADFISSVLDWSGGSPWGHESRVQGLFDWALQNGRFKKNPEPGDIAVFSFSGCQVDHASIVERVEEASFNSFKIETIGGNEGYSRVLRQEKELPPLIPAIPFSGAVLRNQYLGSDPHLIGFITPY